MWFKVIGAAFAVAAAPAELLAQPTPGAVNYCPWSETAAGPHGTAHAFVMSFQASDDPKRAAFAPEGAKGDHAVYGHGDMCLYGSAGDTRTVEFRLPHGAIWRTSRGGPIEVAPHDSGVYGAPSWLEPEISNGSLTISVPYQPGQTYDYRLWYNFVSDPDDDHQIDPSVQNH